MLLHLLNGEIMSSRDRHEQGGLALVIVLIILFTLLVIAAPFVHSMMFQERASFAEVHAARAEVAAESAIDYGAWRALATSEYYERRTRVFGPLSYATDGPQEFNIQVDGQTAKLLDLGRPDGILWGLTVEDEQGKINLLRLPPTAHGSVLRMIDRTGADPRSFTTRYSVRELHWVYPSRIRGFVENGVRVDRMSLYGPNARVRITGPSLARPFYAVSQGLRQDQNGVPYLSLNPAPPAKEGLLLEVEGRYPVNVNTAPPHALAVVFAGLRLRNPLWSGETAGIDDSTALALGREVHARTRSKPFTDYYDFAGFIRNLDLLNDSQKLAVLLNALAPTHDLLDGTGTLPFVFRSFDVVSVEGTASVNNPQKAELAARRVRSVFELTPPMRVEYRLETQLDFERFYQAYVGVGRFSLIQGYPYGNRIVTFPRTVPSERPEVSLDAAGRSYLQMKPAKDLRGRVASLGGGGVFFKRHHYDETIEGTDAGNGIRFPHSEVFASAGGLPYADIPAGGVEFWLRFDGGVPGRANLFDCREDAALNRITFEYRNGELVLTLADECVGGGTANGLTVTRIPFSPKADTWYHVGAYFKGNHFGQVLILRDGFHDPNAVTEHLTPGGGRMWTRLASALDLPPDPANPLTPVDLEDAGWIPSGGLTPLEIGSEVILYDPSTGKGIRGARGTRPQRHPAGALVAPFGYVTQFLGFDGIDPRFVGNGDVPSGFRFAAFGLPEGGTTLASSFTTNDRRTLAGSVGPGDTLIPVVSSGFFANPQQKAVPGEMVSLQNDFPPKGYVRIDNEMVKYEGFGTKKVKIPEGVPNAPVFTVPALKAVKRGGLGTTAADHRQGAQVRVASIHVADNSKLPAPILLDVAGEWMGPVVPDPSDRSLYVPPTNDGNAHILGRGLAGSGRRNHASGERIVPVFAARPNIVGPARYKMGPGDVVTLTDADLQRARAVIRRAVSYRGTTTQLASLTTFSPYTYTPDGLFARILKFPSGELISRAWLAQARPDAVIGPMDATVDEVKFFASPKAPEWRIAGELAAGGSTASVPLQGSGAMNARGGAILVGDEVIGYADLDRENNRLVGVTRAWLNSVDQVHDLGDRLFNLSFLPVSTLESDIGAADRTIPMRQPIDIASNEGYVLIDNEVIFFTKRSGRTLRMPRRLRADEGLYRGRFGTAPASHGARALIYGIPYRHYDTYSPGEFDDTMAYYQFSTSIRDAHYYGVRWDEQGVDGIVTHLQLRFDGRREFYEGADGRWLFDLTRANTVNTLDYHATRTDEASLDGRLLFEFKPGAFYPGDAWKQTPKVYQVVLEYERPWHVLFREER